MREVSEQETGNWKRWFFEGGKADLDAGMSTSRFWRLVDVPVRTWLRWQAGTKEERPPRGRCPQLSRFALRDVVVAHAELRGAWVHRKVSAMTRHDAYQVSQATVLRDEGVILEASTGGSGARSASGAGPRSRRNQQV